MRSRPDTKPAWILAEILKVIRGPDRLGPVGVDPMLLKKWRVGRLIKELRTFRVEDDIATRTTPSRGNPGRFPWGRAVVDGLASDLAKVGVQGYSRPTLFRCLALGVHVGAAADLPRGTKWQTVKAWGTRELHTKLKPGSAARSAPFDPEYTKERILRGLAGIQPEAVVYRLAPQADPTIDAPDAVVVPQGRPTFAVRVRVGIAAATGRTRETSMAKGRASGLPVLTVLITTKGRKRRLAWTPCARGPITAAAVGRWLRDVLDGDDADPYDRGVLST